MQSIYTGEEKPFQHVSRETSINHSLALAIIDTIMFHVKHWLMKRVYVP
jgi:hypothetical protein